MIVTKIPKGGAMFYSTVIALLGLAAVAGLFAGNAENRRQLLKRFLIGVAVVVVGYAAFAVYLWLQREPIIKHLIGLVPGTAVIDALVPESNDAVWRRILNLVWVIFGVAGAGAAAVFLIAFNCRRSAKNLWLGIGGTAATLAVFYFISIWLFQGLAVFIIFFSKFSYAFPTGKALVATAIFIGIVCLVWTLYSFFSRRRGWKVLTAQIAIIAGSAATIWLTALAAAASYAYTIRNTAQQDGVTAKFMKPELPPELAAAKNELAKCFDSKLLQLPLCGYKHWMPDDSSESFKISPEEREYTLQIFDSPQMDEYCDNRLKLLKRMTADKTVDYFPMLSQSREYAKLRVGRAALYRETGHPEKIIPELMKITVLDEDILNDSPLIITELVRGACRNIWAENVVKLGPDAPEYAPDYRRALEFMKTRRVSVPSDSEYFLGCLDNISPKNYGEFVAVPAMYATFAKSLSHALEVRPYYAELETCEVFEPINMTSSPNSDNPERRALIGRASIVQDVIGLALKCHRAERGAYPATLAKLVPEYLDKIPVSPYTGQPPFYTTDGASFTLTLTAPDDEGRTPLTSIPEY